MTTPSSSTPKKYFDLHVTGLGYVYRIREVKPPRADSFLACDISALHGSSDAVEYQRFDVKVTGALAEHLIRRHKKDCDEKKKILIGFRLGDPYVDVFQYKKDHPTKAGQTGHSLKARLLFVSWIKIDGTLVYKADSKSADDAVSETTPASEPPADANANPPAETSDKAAA